MAKTSLDVVDLFLPSNHHLISFVDSVEQGFREDVQVVLKEAEDFAIAGDIMAMFPTATAELAKDLLEKELLDAVRQHDFMEECLLWT